MRRLEVLGSVGWERCHSSRGRVSIFAVEVVKCGAGCMVSRNVVVNLGVVWLNIAASMCSAEFVMLEVRPIRAQGSNGDD